MYKAGHLTLDCTIGEQNNKEMKQQNKIRKCSKTSPLHMYYCIHKHSLMCV